MKQKVKVPAKWYNEYVNDYADGIIQSMAKPSMQQKRIDAVIASGLDYEVMQGGAGHSWTIPLAKLYEFLESAKERAATVPKQRAKLAAFKAKYEPVKGLQGNLYEAKKQADKRKQRDPEFNDENNYHYLHFLMNKYKLCNEQTNKLMEHFIKIEVL